MTSKIMKKVKTSKIMKKAKTSVTPNFQILKIAKQTARKELYWIKGKRQELDVYRIPIRYLYFNIENGRYADKMVQLRQENPGVEIDPRDQKWKNQIWSMLKGEYRGTEKDKQPFGLLKQDILARNQLHPGVVLNDGGVLDGNRRLAVLLDLFKTEKNPGRFEYLDAVILPGDVSPEDRWRIEAGLQIGKDEKLDYSPINRLLKIKDGMKLFQDAGNPAKEIANTLMGIKEDDVEWDIKKIELIDQYLDFIKRPLAYNLVSDKMERFEEALTILESARKSKMSPDKKAILLIKLFTIIAFNFMTNWEMRDIKLAIGAAGRAATHKNERALNDLLKVKDKTKLRNSIVEFNEASPTVQEEKDRVEIFMDAMSASKAVNEPLRLAQRAQTNLEQLKETLSNGNPASGKVWDKKVKSLQDILRTVSDLAKKCMTATKKFKTG